MAKSPTIYIFFIGHWRANRKRIFLVQEKYEFKTYFKAEEIFFYGIAYAEYSFLLLAESSHLHFIQEGES